MHDLELSARNPSLLAVGSIYVALKICEHVPNSQLDLTPKNGSKIESFFWLLCGINFHFFGPKIRPPNQSKVVPKFIFRILKTRQCQTLIFVTAPYQKPDFCNS